jgi:hypothetical protein
MTLLHPALLWLLPLAAIPILLHLLTLHRLKTVELSTFRFLFDSYVQQRRRMQFLEALLAMLRTIFLLMLVLLVARPAVRHWNELFHTGSGREVILLFDCSASMNARSGGVAALDRAKSVALTIVDRLGPDDRLTLVRVGSRPEEIFSRFNQDAAVLRDKIEGLKTSPSRANFFAALTQVFGPEAAPRTNPVVYVFTDCQSSGWHEVHEQGLARLVPDETPVLVVNVGSNEPVQNVAVVGNAPRRNRVIAGLPVLLQPRVANYSRTEPADVTLSVLIDEKEVARTNLTLKPGESKTHKVTYTPTEPGTLRGRFEIVAKAADGTAAVDQFPDDNRFLFALSVVPRVKVLLVNGNPAADPFENEALYLRTALTVPSEPREDAKPVAALVGKEALRALDVQEIPEGGLNPETLKGASVVILSNCGGLNATHFGWLRDFVAEGGGLLIFPGDRVNHDLYNTQFFPVPGPLGEQLTAVRFKPPEGDPEKAETFERLAVIDFAHPVLSVFDDPEMHYLRTAHFSRRFPLLLPDQRANTWTLARYATDVPALVESRFHDGRVIVASFPANTRWTNLPLKPEFVPLVLRMVSYVQYRPPLEVPAMVPADGVAEISVTGTWNPATGKVTDSAGRSSPLTLERSGSRLVGAFERTAERDYYTVEVRGAGEPPRVATAAFAVNLAPEESEFESLNESQFRDLLPGAKVNLVDASAEAQQLYGAIGGKEREIWRPLIFVLFAIIGVEFLLATVGGQRKEAEEQRTVAERIRQFSPGTWVGRMTGGGIRH